MYEIFFCNTFKKNIKKFNPILQRLILDKINILRNDPDHPSLRTESLYTGIWGSSVNMDIRLIWKIEENVVYVGDVGKHDIYRLYRNKKKRKSTFPKNQ